MSVLESMGKSCWFLLADDNVTDCGIEACGASEDNITLSERRTLPLC